MTEWQAYARVEPFGPERADLQAGIIAAVIANVHRDHKRRPQPYRPEDFMPDFGRERPEQTWQQQLGIVQMLNAAFGGQDLRGKDGDRRQPDRQDRG